MSTILDELQNLILTKTETCFEYSTQTVLKNHENRAQELALENRVKVRFRFVYDE